MATGSLPFSGSTNGQPILLTGGNDTLHTAAAGTGTSDRWDLAVANSTGAACTVTIYNGSVAAGNIIAQAVALPHTKTINPNTPVNHTRRFASIETSSFMRPRTAS